MRAERAALSHRSRSRQALSLVVERSPDGCGPTAQQGRAAYSVFSVRRAVQQLEDAGLVRCSWVKPGDTFPHPKAPDVDGGGERAYEGGRVREVNIAALLGDAPVWAAPVRRKVADRREVRAALEELRALAADVEPLEDLEQPVDVERSTDRRCSGRLIIGCERIMVLLRKTKRSRPRSRSSTRRLRRPNEDRSRGSLVRSRRPQPSHRSRSRPRGRRRPRRRVDRSRGSLVRSRRAARRRRRRHPRPALRPRKRTKGRKSKARAARRGTRSLLTSSRRAVV